MPLLATRCASTLVLLAALAACAPDDAEAPEEAAIPTSSLDRPAQLAPVDQSDVRGAVRADHDDDDVDVDVSLTGLEPGRSYTVALHAGRCAAGGPVVASLGTVAGGRDGGAELEAEVSAARLSGAEAVFVQVADASGATVACGDVPGHGAP